MAELKARKKKPLALTLTKSLSMSSNTTRLLPYLVLGGQESSADMSTLELLGITHILNVSKDCKCWFDDGKISYCRVPIEDEPAADASVFFCTANDYLTEVRNIYLRGERAAAMVHCKTGMSRSSTMVLCHMLLTEGMLDYIADFTDRRSMLAETNSFHGLPHRACKHITLRDALAYIRERRPRASPNAGFMQQLVELEAQLHNGTVSIDLEKYKRDRFGDVRTFCIGEIDPVTGYTGSSAASINDDVFLLNGGRDSADTATCAAGSSMPTPCTTAIDDVCVASALPQPLRTSKRAPVDGFGFDLESDASTHETVEVRPKMQESSVPIGIDEKDDATASQEAVSGAVRRRSAVGDLPDVHPPVRLSRRSDAGAISATAPLVEPCRVETSSLDVSSEIPKKRRSSTASSMEGQKSTVAAVVAAARADVAETSAGDTPADQPSSNFRGSFQLTPSDVHESIDTASSSYRTPAELEGIHSLQLGSDPRPLKAEALPILSNNLSSALVSPVAAAASWNVRGKDVGAESVSMLSVHGYSIFTAPQAPTSQGTSVSPAASNSRPMFNRS
jgi:protein-tyrosine phosphatase